MSTMMPEAALPELTMLVVIVVEVAGATGFGVPEVVSTAKLGAAAAGRGPAPGAPATSANAHATSSTTRISAPRPAMRPSPTGRA